MRGTIISLVSGLLLLSSGLTVSCPEEAHPCAYRTSSDPHWGTLHIIGNRFLEVGIAKSAGRITSIMFKPTGHNFLYNEGEVWGGLIEWVKVGSGMLIPRWRSDIYKIYPPHREKGSISITVEGKIERRGYSLLFKRTMKIWGDLPILEVSTECKNVGEKELKDFSYGIHPQLTIGGDNRNDLIFIPEEEVTEGIDFYKTKKREWKNINASWFGGIDQKNGEGLFFLFPKNSIGWVGKYIGTKFYNLEFFYKPILLAPKATANYKFEIVITSGMRKCPILINNNSIILPTQATEKKRYCSNEDVKIFFALHSQEIPEQKMLINLTVQKEKTVLRRWEEVLPLKHGILNLTWNTGDRKDGFYQVVCSLSSNEGKIGEVSTEFEVCGRLKQEAGNLIRKLEKALLSFQKDTKDKKGVQKILWANSFLEEAKRCLQREDYAMAKNWAKRGIEKLE